MPAHEKFPLLIVTGQQGEGKTSLLLTLIDYLKTYGLKPGGIISNGIWKNQKRDEIKAVNLYTGEEILFCQRDYRNGWTKVGNFYINPLSQEFSMKAVMTGEPDYYVLDELGKFELEGNGWFEATNYLIKNSYKPVIASIRDSFVDLITNKFSILPEKIVSVKQSKVMPLHGLLPDSINMLLINKN